MFGGNLNPMEAGAHCKEMQNWAGARSGAGLQQHVSGQQGLDHKWFDFLCHTPYGVRDRAVAHAELGNATKLYLGILEQCLAI